MTKTLTLTAALAAVFATTASAAEIRVSLTGKDAATVRADIQRAAREVCRQELTEKAWLGSYARCVDDAFTRAMASASTIH